MKLIKILAQNRRDFQGQYECEFCGNEETDNSMNSYDDRYFHDNVIPNVKCSKCGKSTNSEGGTVEHTATKYPEGYQI